MKKSYKKEISRKLIHLSSLWIPVFIYFVHPGIAIITFSVLCAGNIIVEYGYYKKQVWARYSYGMLFSRILRKKETRHTKFQVSGSIYVLLAAIACTFLFSKEVAAISLTIMLISDTVAALVGKAYGTRLLYKNKSIEGTASFFLSALLINLLFSPLYTFTYAGVIASAVATLAEMFEDKLEIDDNLSIPLFVGSILTLLNW